MSYFKNLISVLVFVPVLANCQISPVICLNQGTGECYKGSWKDGFASFQGIKYAEPPVGELRFKSPKPFIAKDGFYDVSGNSKVKCPQFDFLTKALKGQEDCLMLNVYVPELAFSSKPDTKLPVMVWIHGGALAFGSGEYEEYGPQHLVNKGVVIVSINYRLGPLGYLSMGNENVPGNAGFRDQHLALSWVQNNVAEFGGDPNSVTIFGESAGATSVAVHMVSPMSKGLFHQVILQSVALSSSWGPITQDHALEYSEIFAGKLDCNQKEVGDDNDEIIKCLQSKETAEIMNLSDLYGNEDGVFWNAVPDQGFTSKPFLPAHPEELMANGQFNKDIKVIIGTTADEGILPLAEPLASSNWEKFQTKFKENGPNQLFNFNRPNQSEITEEMRENTQKIVEYYVGSMDNITEKNKQGMFDMFTDAFFLHGTHKTIKHLIQNNVTIFQYILTYEGKFSVSQFFGIAEPEGVSHGDDLIYLFDPLSGEAATRIRGTLSGDDALVRDLMTSTWTNFAIYGHPTPPGKSNLNWTKPLLMFTPKNQYFNISGPDSVMDSSKNIEERMSLWDNIMGANQKQILQKMTRRSNIQPIPIPLKQGFDLYSTRNSFKYSHQRFSLKQGLLDKFNVLDNPSLTEQ